MGNYSWGAYSTLPTDDADLSNILDAAALSQIASDDTVRLAQPADGMISIIQFKDTITAGSATVRWNGQSNVAPSTSAVNLEIYNRSGTPAWESLASDNTTAADTDLTLSSYISDLTDYKNVNDIACRVYQAAGGVPSSITDDFSSWSVNWLNGSTWGVSGGNAVNTPSAPGSDLVTNGNFSGWTDDNPNSWEIQGTEDATKAVHQVGSGESHTGSGTGMCNIWSEGAPETMGIAQPSLTASRFYRNTVDINTVTSGGIRAYHGYSGRNYDFTTTGSKVYVLRSFSGYDVLITSATGTDVTIDNKTVYLLTLGSLITGRQMAEASVNASIDITGQHFPAGVALNIDPNFLTDPTTAANQNFILVYHDGYVISIDECVAGTFNLLAAVGITYVDGYTLMAKKIDATHVSAYYNGVEKIASTVCTSNTNVYHGIFSTGGTSEVQLDNLSIVPYS